MRTLYQLFSGSNPLNSMVIIIFAIFLWLPSIYSANSMDLQFPDNPMPLFGILAGIFEKNILLSSIFSFSLFMLNAFLLSYLNTRYILVPERTFLPAYFYLVIGAFFPGLYQLNPFLPSSFFILLILFWFFKSYKADDNSRLFFETGLLLGTAGLFYAPSLYFILFVWISLSVLRPFFWREWVYPVLGVLTIFLLTWGYYFVVYGKPTEFFYLLSLNINPALMEVKLPLAEMIAVSYLIIMTILSSIYMVKVYQYRKIYARKYYIIFFWLFVLCLIIFLFLSGDNYSMFYVTGFSLSYILTNYFVYSKKILLRKYLLFTLSFLLVILVVLNRLFLWF